MGQSIQINHEKSAPQSRSYRNFETALRGLGRSNRSNRLTYRTPPLRGPATKPALWRGRKARSAVGSWVGAGIGVRSPFQVSSHDPRTPASPVGPCSASRWTMDVEHVGISSAPPVACRRTPLTRHPSPLPPRPRPLPPRPPRARRPASSPSGLLLREDPEGGECRSHLERSGRPPQEDFRLLVHLQGDSTWARARQSAACKRTAHSARRRLSAPPATDRAMCSCCRCARRRRRWRSCRARRGSSP